MCVCLGHSCMTLMSKNTFTFFVFAKPVSICKTKWSTLDVSNLSSRELPERWHCVPLTCSQSIGGYIRLTVGAYVCDSLPLFSPNSATLMLFCFIKPSHWFTSLSMFMTSAWHHEAFAVTGEIASYKTSLLENSLHFLVRYCCSGVWSCYVIKSTVCCWYTGRREHNIFVSYRSFKSQEESVKSASRLRKQWLSDSLGEFPAHFIQAHRDNHSGPFNRVD